MFSELAYCGEKMPPQSCECGHGYRIISISILMTIEHYINQKRLIKYFSVWKIQNMDLPQ